MDGNDEFLEISLRVGLQETIARGQPSVNDTHSAPSNADDEHVWNAYVLHVRVYSRYTCSLDMPLQLAKLMIDKRVDDSSRHWDV